MPEPARVLVLNCGSSSLKFGVFDVRADGKPARVMGGLVQGVGGAAALKLIPEQAGPPPTRRILDHREGIQWMTEVLTGHGLGLKEIGAVGHRVVHGGRQFRQATVIDREVLAAIQAATELAPLHNQPSLAGIQAARSLLGDLPMVAVFDTAFHVTLPPHASTYALSWEIAERHGIRRYGFHGIAHASLAAGYAALTGRSLAGMRLITLHLGHGCSATAIHDGRSVDTSMGLTPLEGLVMGTRCGDLDPAIVAYLARCESLEVEEIDRQLNEESGLLGVSGRSSNMRELLALAGQDPRAALAVELFCYRARKYLGAYLAALGGADAVIFGGGIGEHEPVVRAKICAGMEWCGLAIAPELNNVAVGADAVISPKEATLPAYVIRVDEESLIARDTFEAVRRQA
jgi:acetate kinase